MRLFGKGAGLRAWAAAIGLAAAFASPAIAHRQHVAHTTVEFTEDGRVEVVHSLHAHDVEPALSAPGDAPIIIDDLRSRAQAAIYVAERFSLTVDGRRLDLEILGAEREGQHLFVYQEATASAPAEVRVEARMLFERHTDQRNQVNVTWPDGRRATANLRPADAPAVLSRPNAT